MKKAKSDDYEGRAREVISDPNNRYIVRQKDAGKIINGLLIMHNGICVFPDSYGEMTQIIESNKGVHEPQEERIFAKVLPYIREGGVMIELGAYWAFYSMWFYKEVKNARCYLLEQDKERLEIGRNNFKLNNMRGDFVLGKIGRDGINLEIFLRTKGINHVDILHSDIQGAELEMLWGAEDSIINGKISYIFISSHSQELHYRCLDFLKKRGYLIIVSADYNTETFCWDGVLVAKLARIPGLSEVNIELASWRCNSFWKGFIIKLCPHSLRPSLHIAYYNLKSYILFYLSNFLKLLKVVRLIIKKEFSSILQFKIYFKRKT